MRRVLLSIALGLVLAAPASAASPATGRLLVTLRPSADDAGQLGAAAVVASVGARRAGRSVAALRLVTVRPASGESLRSLARRLRADRRVAGVQLEHRGRPRYVPNDPALGTPEPAPGVAPGTTLEWWVARSRFPEAWDLTRGGGALVAIIDTGVDASHPELAGRIVGAASFAAGSPANTDSVGHGTHVASLACAASDNGIGLAGAGLGCGLLIAKTDFTDSSIAAAIVWAVNHGADAISMSFGTDPGTAPSEAVRNAIAYAAQRDVVLVAAAADADVDEQGYPADLLQPTGTGPRIAAGVGLSVTAVGADDARAPFAGRGSQISLAAYGAYGTAGGPPGIFGASTAGPNELDTGVPGSSSRPPCGCRTVLAGDPRYAYLQGTSMATPMVAAVAALMRHLNPDLPVARVVRLLKATARRPAGLWTADLGWGILDAGAAVAHAAALDLRRPVSRVTRLPARTTQPFVTVRWHGHDDGPAGVRVSGIVRYQLYRAVDDRPARRLLSTTATSARLRLRAGHLYRFYTLAVDAAGNRERTPGVADTRIERR